MLSIKHLCVLAFPFLCCGPPAYAATHASEMIFTALDVETTGLSPSKHRIVEVSAVRFQGTNILAKRTWLLDPGVPIPPAAARVHGITDKMVKDKPVFSEICDDLSALLTNSTVVAHNARFDWKFISAEYQKAERAPPSVPVVDSLRLARKAFPALESYALHNLAKDLKLKVSPVHRAEADAMTLVDLTQRCIAAIGGDGRSLLRKMRINTEIPASKLGNGLKPGSE